MKTLVAKGKSGNWYSICNIGSEGYCLSTHVDEDEKSRLLSGELSESRLDIENYSKDQFIGETILAIGEAAELGDFLDDFGHVPIGRILEIFEVVEIQ